MNVSLTISKSIEIEDTSIENKSNIYIKEDINGNNKNNEFKNKNGNNIYKKNKNRNKLVKNSLSMPNLFFPNSEKNFKQKTKNNQFNSYLHPKKRVPLILLEKKVHKNFVNNYINKNNNYYNIQKIDEIVNNEKSHLVAEFKDFLILGDIAEFFQKCYIFEEIQELFSQILEYYTENLFIFPNYVILPESKYIYSNIQKKQKIIDIQEENEENENKTKNTNINSDVKTIFNNKEIESILNQTDTSGIKQYFGITETSTENSNGIDKNKKQILKLIDNISDYEKNNNNGNKKIFYKINKNIIKKDNKNNKNVNSRNKINSKISVSEIHKNENKISYKRNNFSQPNLINQSNTLNGLMISSINNKNKNNYKQSSKTNNREGIIGQNNNKKLIDKNNKIVKKSNNLNNSLTHEKILINNNSNINNNMNNNNGEIKSTNIMKINKNILNEINNHQSNKNQNIFCSIKNKNYKKLLMNVLLSSSMGTINDNGKTKSNFHKKTMINKNKYNSEADSIKDNYLTSTINKREKSASIGKKYKDNLTKNKNSSSCKNISISSYLDKKLKISRKNINYWTTRNKGNYKYKLLSNTNKSISQNINKKNSINAKNINNINNIGNKIILDNYKNKETNKNKRKSNSKSKSKDSTKTIIDFKLLKKFKDKKYKNSMNKSKNSFKNKTIKNIHNLSDKKGFGFLLTDRKTKEQIDNNLEKIEKISKKIKKIKENLKNSAEKIPKISFIKQRQYKSSSKKIENNNKKNTNNNNVIKVYLPGKTRNTNINKKDNNNSTLNFAYTYRKINSSNNDNKIINNYKIINSKNVIININQKDTIDNFNKTKYNTIVNHKKNF